MHFKLSVFWAGLVLQSVLAQSSESVLRQSGPSFSCAHVTSHVNKLICASGSLSALDRELALVFDNMRGQPMDQKKLRADEDAWLATLKRDCSDSACIQKRYESRIAELKDQSLHAASPAAYEETRPFPAPAELMREAQLLIGKTCLYQANVAGPVVPGFGRAARFLPVISSGGVTVVGEKGGWRFAFLTFSIAGSSGCEIRDVVALPQSAVGDRFLQCSANEPAMTGFGVRNPGTHGLDGFWSVDPDGHKLQRIAMGVLGIEKSVKCQQPESGE